MALFTPGVVGKLEVEFAVPLHELYNQKIRGTPLIYGVSPGGAIFPVGCLKDYDLKKDRVVLTEDFTCKITKKHVVFKTKSNDLRIFVRMDLINRIADLVDRKILYMVPLL